MAYSKNPQLPRLRAKACEMVSQGQTVSQVARHFGYTKSAVSKWYAKYPEGGAYIIPTESARPHHHPSAVTKEVEDRIVALRIALKGRCGEVIHSHLIEEGYTVSLRSVQRTLDRRRLLKKRSPWKRYHAPMERPEAQKPGDLVQLDTIHLMATATTRIYIYTLLDVYSRWAYAFASERINAGKSVLFLRRAEGASLFPFHMLQSDHGSEFSTHFTERAGILHRHSRVRRPNDNAHLERFNRTLQDEFLNHQSRDPRRINRALPEYMAYYNTERKHLGLNLKTPQEIITKCFQAIV